MSDSLVTRPMLQWLYQEHIERLNDRFERRFGRPLRPGEIVRALSRFDRRVIRLYVGPETDR